MRYSEAKQFVKTLRKMKMTKLTGNCIWSYRLWVRQDKEYKWVYFSSSELAQYVGGPAECVLTKCKTILKEIRGIKNVRAARTN